MRGLRLWSESWPTQRSGEEHVPDTGRQCWRAPLPGAPQWRHPKELSAAFRKHRERRGWEHCTWEEGALWSRAGSTEKGQGGRKGHARGSVVGPGSVLMPAPPQVFTQSITHQQCWPPEQSQGPRSGEELRADAGPDTLPGKQGRGHGNPRGPSKHSGGTELLAHSAHRLKPSGWITTGRGHWRMLGDLADLKKWKIPRLAKTKNNPKL